jgi:molybdopterin-containing oxidoreductase family iron-sulfur binding subunit
MSKDNCTRSNCKPITRRNFLKSTAAGAATLAIPVGTSDASIWQSFFQKHFLEMSSWEKTQVIRRMEKEYGDKYKTSFTIKTTGAAAGTLFGYGLDLSRCIGCRRCVYA